MPMEYSPEYLGVAPKKMTALLVLAHGAGAGMRHPAMAALAEALGERGIGTLRYEFAYMAAGKKRPDPPNVAVARGKIPDAKGIVCFAFPLHPPKKPGTERAAHLADLATPTLFIQGTRDDLAELALLRGVVKAHHRVIELHVVDGADHGFAVLKKSGRTGDEALAEVADAAARFISSCRS